jgi:methyl-accepting chemotaxis protein
MAKLNLTWRIALAVGVAVFTGVCASGMLVFQLQRTSATYDAILGQDQVQHQDRARVMQVEFKKQVQEWKDLLLRGRKFEDFQKYKTAFTTREAAVHTMAEALLKDVKDPDAHKKIQDFMDAHQKMGVSYAAAIEAFSVNKGGDFGAADAMVKGMDRPPTDAVDALVARLQQVIVGVREAQKADVAASIRWSTITVMAVFVGILFVVALIIRTTRREMVDLAAELIVSAQQTTSAAGQVSTSAQSLSQGATEQAAALEETSASMEEMASMTRKNAENATHAAALVTDVAAQVGESNAALAGMVASMASIKESSNKVAKIIKTIDEIAFQTNILALNAAVEAARAGEAGMGFAVVADEVRNLAQRSAQAAKDTAELIEESIARSNEGAGKVEQVAKAIGTITGSVAQVKGIVQDVREASQQQTQGIDQVSQAIAQMEKVTQTTAATAEESAAASEELNAQAETSLSVIGKLQVLVGGGQASDVGYRAPAPAAGARPAPKAARLVKLPSKLAGKPKQRPSAEDEIPMGDTGTYGKF